MQDYEVAILGASFAGLSAAIMLARARRRVVMVDMGPGRNRFAAQSHGVLGLDGASPAEIRDLGLAQVLAYPTAAHVTGRVEAITRDVEGAGVFTLSGTFGAVKADRLILAHGQRDVLPAIPGLAECWGVTANQCPFCHGYELADRPTGILMLNGTVPHHVHLLSHWTRELILLANGHPVDPAHVPEGVRLIPGNLAQLDHRDGEITAAILDDGASIPMTALYLAPPQEPASPLAAQLGCAMEDAGNGPFVKVDMFQRTSVPGLFAAGDLTRPFASAPAAAASGTMAGAACTQDLLGILPPLAA